MNEPPWNNVITNFCANCQYHFESNSQKATNLDIVGLTNLAGDENNVADINVPILDALIYVYGLSYDDFAQVFPENINTTIQYFSDVGRQELALCCNCLEVFRDVYYINLKFENLTRKDALLRKVIQFKRDKVLSLKIESQFTENEDDYLDSLNSNLENESGVNLGLEIKTEYIEPNSYHLNTECTKLSPSEKGKIVKNLLIEKPKKPTSKVRVPKVPKGKSQKGKTESKTAATAKPPNGKDDSGLQTFGRLTRSKVNLAGTKLKNNITKEEEDEFSSSPASDFEDQTPKKTKQPIKRKKISCVSKSLKSCEIENQINPNATESTNPESSNATTKNSNETQSKGSQDYVIRSGNGKRLVYACNLCGKSFTRLKMLKVHLNAHKKAANKEKRMKRRKVKCPHCDKVCRNEDSLKIHISKWHSEEPKVCDKCGKTFLRMESFKLHLQYSHSEEKSFECGTCGMKYKWKASLLSHELTHKIPRPHVCEKCGISYTNKSNLNQHKTYHEDEERDKELFRCKECNKLLKNRKSLQKHINRTHREDKQGGHSCPTCGITMKRKENLTAHMKIHDPNRIFNKIVSPKPNKIPNVATDGESAIQSQLTWSNYQL